MSFTAFSISVLLEISHKDAVLNAPTFTARDEDPDAAGGLVTIDAIAAEKGIQFGACVVVSLETLFCARRKIKPAKIIKFFDFVFCKHVVFSYYAFTIYRYITQVKR